MDEALSGDSEPLSNKCHINDLPDEILEYILSLLRPYRDLNCCMLVCKRWNKNAIRVLHHKKLNFNRCLSNFDIQWEHYTPKDKEPHISKRYSHSACSNGNWMYVFGGCTCNSTTFNDLWRLDLSSRKWDRLLTMGTYPTPKALATLVHYQGQLVLFGGWTHPTPFPLHQAWRTFHELHIYDIECNRWSSIVTPALSPPPMAGHSATVHGDEMVVFGGICGLMVTGSSNSVWCYNFLTQSWREQETSSQKPMPRYNQSQIEVDDEHLIIMGGCGGRPSALLNDVWMLTMSGPVWRWTELTVVNPQWALSHPSNGQLWCHPACKIGTKVIAIGRDPAQYGNVVVPKRNLRPRNQPADDTLPRRASEPAASPPVDRDVNVNGRRGSLTMRGGSAVAGSSATPDTPPASEPRRSAAVYRNMNLPTSNNMAAFRATPPSTAGKHRERQLEVLHRMEERLRNLSQSAAKDPPPPPPLNKSTIRMVMFVMDISRVLEDLSVTWLPLKTLAPGGPEHTILYSLVPGQAEVIMFGGIQKDVSLFSSPETMDVLANTPTNELHFITAPKTVI